MLILLLVFITVPATALLFLQNKKIQNKLSNYITSEISEYFGTAINVKDISITFFNRFQLKDVYLEDLNGDTLLFSDKVKVTLNKFNRAKKEIGIKRITLKEADIHFVATDSTGINLNFIIDEIRNPDKPESEKWKLEFTNIQLDNSRFRFTDPYKEKKGSPIDYTSMDLKDLNIRISDLIKSGDTVSFDIKRLECTEKSGFKLTNLNSRLSLSKHHMHYNNVYIETPLSNVSANAILFNFESYRDFSDFVNQVDIDFSLRSSSVNFADIGYFSAGMDDFNETLRISGRADGKISDMSANNILIAFSDHTFLGGSLNMIGLPDISETFIHFNIDMLQTTIGDIQKIHLPEKKRLKIPDNFKALGTITYSGKFTGYYDDFVTYGRFGTSLGAISTDILLKPDNFGGLIYRGSFKTNSFALGSIIPNNEDRLGNISISAEVDGLFQKKEISADLNGKINHLELYGYDYKNISLEGFITEETFDGSMAVSDPNIHMDFQGKVDFSSEQPKFNFIADVSRLRPYYLHLNRTDPSYFVSFLLESDFSGIHPDSINGEIKLVNSFFQRSGEQIQIYDLNLRAENSGNSSLLEIRSDVLDADVYGRFNYSKIPGSILKLTANYLPALTNDTAMRFDDSFIDETELDFSFHFKEVENVARFFTRDFFLGDNSFISGHFNPAENDLAITADISSAGYKDNYWTKLQLIAESDSESIEYTGVSNHLTVNEDLGIDNFNISGKLIKDTLTTGISWSSINKPVYSGNLNLKAGLSTNRISGNKKIAVELQPSFIVFNDTVWNIAASKVNIDSSAVKIDSFIISNHNQALILAGEISHKTGSRLAANFRELDLATLNLFTGELKLKLGGTLSGQASLINPYQNPVFLSDLIMNDFYINEQDFGQGNIRAQWKNDVKGIHILASSVKGVTQIFKIDGDYFPNEKNIDFDVDFDKIRLSAFEPLSSKLVSDIKGLGKGKLVFKGTTEKPRVNGEISFFKASAMVNYLQTRYSFTDRVSIKDNNVILNDFTLTDERGNIALASGSVTNKNFSDFYLNLNISTTGFWFLNTTQADNELFHGSVLASGIVKFSGPPDNLHMEINAKTERNSVFNIPLDRSEEVNENDFIRFVNTSDEKIENQKEEPEYEVNLKGLTMDFNLEITPDAEVQIIFDPRIGDILQGRGNGNLTMSINTLGKFEMYGDMVIQEGDYLFTLQNLINKKLQVEPGGTLSWNGDPADANINLKAVYKLRTSVSTLSPEADDRLKQRIPVECQIIMTGKLLKPNIQTDIVLPTTDQQTRNIVSNSINTEEEKLKQFISLLVMNNFMSLNPGEAFVSGSGSGSTANMAGVATSELLSNQLSHLLSQISKDFDIGLNYRPGDQITTDELEVALSTQILDDRISINGNLDVRGDQTTRTSAATNPNNIVGDFDIDFKITENGKLHLKAFNRANDNLLFQTSPYTQGVGVFYREDFDSFGELLKRYRDALFSLFTRRKETEKEEETTMIKE